FPHHSRRHLGKRLLQPRVLLSLGSISAVRAERIFCEPFRGIFPAWRIKSSTLTGCDLFRGRPLTQLVSNGCHFSRRLRLRQSISERTKPLFPRARPRPDRISAL